ncbi:HNH endonuclease [Mesomycoplasma lagogenitalium]|uniref:HNH endonuclease n=1 Tax=Mesomycoplasma lagogenitalium TaxID=171286 RepID=A0ABY8LWG1_9BACT|nr:HNH endonuclease [Mesomycoplasma lagogenitalium]WGI36462.1 HNH endonuclease [Mesomycoplasma lagogenitalium]
MINWKYPYNSKEWITIKNEHLNKFPYCKNCFTTLNLQVDHILEHNNNLNLFLNKNNLQTLCWKCHGNKSLYMLNLKKLNVKDIKIKINLNVENGLNIEGNEFLFSDVKRFLNYGNFYVINLKQNNLTPSQVDKLIQYLVKFFITIKFISFNIVFNNAVEFDLSKIFKIRMGVNSD